MIGGALLSLGLFLQWSFDYALLTAEDARADPAPLIEALGRPEASVQRQALRALGRFERPELAAPVLPFLTSPDPELRIEAANALAQMQAPVKLAPYLEREKDPHVRAWLYEAIGRLPAASETLLVPGLSEEDTVRFGAVKGLEHFLRTTSTAPGETTVLALRRAVRESRAPAVQRLALLALNRAGDRDRPTLEAALESADPQVRRLAVRGLGAWREDPSYIVRYAALEVGFDCDRAEAALSDPSAHVALQAIDLLGNDCPPAPVEKIVREETGWRRRARALVSLARTNPAAATEHLPRFVEHAVWQARAYAARAAKILGDGDALRRLRDDEHPNVVAEALVTPEDALAALDRDDYGLLMKALSLLQGWKDGASAVPTLLETLGRVTGQGKDTSRDPRRLLLDRLNEFGDESIAKELEYLLADFDPEIARRTAAVLSEKTGRRVEAKTDRFVPDPLPSKAFLQGLFGARARFRMKEAGTFVIELLPEAAPLTVARFAELAESGYYDGLTFHRIVPNFVLQGGSPGANEYEGAPEYLRDEVGLVSHERGTLGISTRGRDTGDSQIFINLADNYRLDHNYTVFAQVVEGLENVDSIQEGDVMVSVEILRKR